jgi:uncharacterized protein involved in exopolysaccharide biosynthesis
MRTKYVSLEKGDSLIAEALSQSQGRYVEARARAQVVVSMTTELTNHIQAGRPIAGFPPVSSDALVSAIQARLAAQQNELAGLLERYREKHPSVIQAMSKIDETKTAIDQQAQQVVSRLLADAKLAFANEEILKANVEEWEQRQFEWNRAKMDYDVLWRKAETKKALYNAMLARVNELDVGQRERLNNIRIVDRATPPATFVKPSLPITIALPPSAAWPSPWVWPCSSISSMTPSRARMTWRPISGCRSSATSPTSSPTA